ncbi:MAG: extracellular solute-binding protein [Lachnospiraceae bacterium]|nr:extracellular solute-binding protein [Lachnospiraceae bacterium]
MKKLWYIFVCILLLYGCGKTENVGGKEIGSANTALTLCEQHSGDKVTLEWYVNYSWFTVPWGENVVSRQITEDTGISIRFLSPKGNENERLNAMISSDSLPDIVTLGWWEPQLNVMIDKDMVYALNELAQEYDPYFFEVSQEAVRSWYTSEDGGLYCYPNTSFMPSDYETYDTIGSNQTFLVRKDIYEAIGSPDMTTPEGFQAAVRKAVQEFPEIDGRELIPIGAHEFTNTGCASFDQYLQNFLAIPYEKNGKYYDRDTDPEYIRWLKAFRELGAEGYLKGDIFIDQRTQMEEKLAQGRYFCMLYQRTDMADQQKILYSRDPDSIYIAVNGPKNTKGDDPMLPGAGINGWTVTLISRNCKRPDRAIELIDYMLSEKGQKMLYLGVEGVTYDMIDGDYIVREEVKALSDTDRVAYDQLYGADNTYWMLQNITMQLPWRGELEPPLGQLEEWTYPYTHYLGQYELTYQTGTEAGNNYTKIKKLWSQVLPKLLLAPTEQEFDQILADFIKAREEMGFDTVINEAERQFKKAKDKLGLE